LGGLLALMMRYQKRWGRRVWVALSSGVPALVVEGVLAIGNGRELSLRNWLLGFLFTSGAMLIVRFGLPMRREGFRS
jgi:hypothetical protein